MKRRLIAVALACLLMTGAGAETLSTNKARYAPGEEVVLSIPDAQEATVTLQHLNEPPVVVWEGKIDDGAVSFTSPSQDYTGYLIEVDTGNERSQIALDVSSDPLRFPRYGYVWDYTPGAGAEEKIEDMNRYHINLIQYYDWKYRHHLPLADNLDGWEDWSGRWIDGRVLNAYLEAAHQHGMTNMAYNMMYGANRSYLTDGSNVDPEWRLVNYNGADFTFTMSDQRGDVGILQFMNPLNEEWQDYIFARMGEVFDTLAFDGWHADTIGEYGSMRTASGEALGVNEEGKPIYLVKDTYTQFINAAKEALPDTYFAFNPVGAQGIENVCRSNADILYAEFWPWDKSEDGTYYLLYDAIQKEIFNAADISGGKSLVVAAYINYKHPEKTFNTPAVVLMDAVCYASGGSRIELGNGSHMLSNEYFPGDLVKNMDDELRQRTVRMYDFITAYENVLRDGQSPVECNVSIADEKVSENGKKNTVWAFAMEDEKRAICHLINLTGTDAVWRDEQQKKAAPRKLEELSVKWYVEDGSTLWLASPDGVDIAPVQLDFERGKDLQGSYISFTIPGLEYWDMICLEK